MKQLGITLLAISVSVITVGCGQADPQAESVQINVNPATLADAGESLAQIEQLLRVQADDPRALEALEQLRPRLDELNQLRARVEVRPGQFVSFYETEPGVIGVAESGPVGAAAILGANDLEQSLVPLYEKLSGGAKAPVALIEAEERARELVAASDQLDEEVAPNLVSMPKQTLRAAGSENVGSVAQALTEGDGQWWRDNACFLNGDFTACIPNWTGGDAFAQANTRTSFLSIAPYRAPSPVRINLKYNNVLRFVDSAFQGEWRNYQWFSAKSGCSGPECLTTPVMAFHRWDITESAGKGFHFTFAAKWNCGPLNCTTWPR